jgi:hypothetical protein
MTPWLRAFSEDACLQETRDLKISTTDMSFRINRHNSAVSPTNVMNLGTMSSRERCGRRTFGVMPCLPSLQRRHAVSPWDGTRRHIMSLKFSGRLLRDLQDCYRRKLARIISMGGVRGKSPGTVSKNFCPVKSPSLYVGSSRRLPFTSFQRSAVSTQQMAQGSLLPAPLSFSQHCKFSNSYLITMFNIAVVNEPQ